ncbi:hypothetical protein KR018_001916 [Drosophila ironensis]|nr:hypothetical protein KR018_001916 [Drosophila ironensis]
MLLLWPLVLCLLLVAFLIRPGIHWRRLGVKGPIGWPLVGNMLRFLLGQSSYGEVYERIYREHPHLRYVGFFRLFNEPALLIRDQELVRQVLVGSSFANCSENELYVDQHRDPLASCNPFIARGELWRLYRSDLVALFTPSRLRHILGTPTRTCQQLRRLLQNRDKFEAKDLATRYTLQVVASLIFGLDAQCLEADDSAKNRWLEWLLPLFQPSSWSLAETIALLHSPMLGEALRYRYVPMSLQNWLRDLVAMRSGGDNLLNLLAQGKRSLSEGELTGHATTLLLEGYETSAMLLAFALHELASNQDVQHRLFEELDDEMASSELKYAEAVLLETLRLHPAMQALQKRCVKSFALPGQSLSEDSQTLQVSEGTVLVLPVQAIHLDPELHPEPLKFRPERFLDQTTPMGCRFLAFGAGPRMCPGMRLGIHQTKVALAALLQDRRVFLADENQTRIKVSPLTFLTASSQKIWLRLEARSSVKGF